MLTLSEAPNSIESSPIQPFRVWLRPNGFSWRISVDSGVGARWLTRRLGDEGFATTELVQNEEDLHCTFRCVTDTRRERDYVEHLLIRWPEVCLQHSPEYSRPKLTVPDGSALLAEPMHRAAEPQNVQMDVTPFRVWIRPLGNAWKLRAEGREGTDWLCRELIHRGLTCSDPMEIPRSTLFQFRCMSATPRESSYVWRLLNALPQVMMQNAPA